MLYKFADETTYIECSATGRKYKIRRGTHATWKTLLHICYIHLASVRFAHFQKVFKQVSSIATSIQCPTSYLTGTYPTSTYPTILW